MHLLTLCLLFLLFTGLSLSWIEIEDVPNLSWSSSVVNIDGHIIYVASSKGEVYSSSNFGLNWSQIFAGGHNWTSLTLNSTGQFMVAATISEGIFVINSGTASVSNAQNFSWTSVSCDCSGRIIIAVANDSIPNVSFDGGTSWNGVSLPLSTWFSSYMSCSGQYIAAALNNGPDAGIYVSSDSGSSWSRSPSTSSVSGWTSIAGSSSGQHLVACVYSGKIYTSSDYGVSWSVSGGSVTANWISVASDGTGRYLAGAVLGGALYQSQDYGVSWSVAYSAPTSATQQWRSVSCDDSGEVCVAVAQNGGVYVGNITAADSPVTPFAEYPTSQPTKTPTPFNDSASLYFALLAVGATIILCIVMLLFYTGYIRCKYFMSFSNMDANGMEMIIPTEAEAVRVEDPGTSALGYSCIDDSVVVVLSTDDMDEEAGATGGDGGGGGSGGSSRSGVGVTIEEWIRRSSIGSSSSEVGGVAVGGGGSLGSVSVIRVEAIEHTAVAEAIEIV